MTMNTQGRPSTPGEAGSSAGRKTFTGNRGLEQNEPLIFEIGSAENCGVDLPEPANVAARLGGLRRNWRIAKMYAATAYPGVPSL